MSRQHSYPAGFINIIANEAAERFSYYGMKAILVVFMTTYLKNNAGELAPLSEAEARSWYHFFSSANYFFPAVGAILADAFWGKYKTIIRLSMIYCLGHLVLALMEDRMGLALGLTLIAVGSGGIKPCVSAHLGDQFTAATQSLMSKAFAAFYLAINLGGFVSTLLTPLLLYHYGPAAAFGVPGICMLLATLVFWLGRNTYRALPPVSPREYLAIIMSPPGRRAFSSLTVLYLFAAVFWALYDQTGSAWVLQAQHLDTALDFSALFGAGAVIEVLPAQLQALNPILVILLIPLCSYTIYPRLERIWGLSALRKVGLGMLLATAAFLIVAYTESRLELGEQPGIIWQVWAYLFMTLGEVMVSITLLEFAYTQAPEGLKSLITSFYLLSISLGNLLTALINTHLVDRFQLAGSAYYLFFSGLMLITTAFYALWSRGYREENYLSSGSHPAH